MKIYLTTFAAICFFTVSLQAQKTQLITLDTENTGLVLSVDQRGDVHFEYYGRKIPDPAPFLLKNSYRRADFGTDPMALPTSGGRNFRYPALGITHADGSLNMNLVYTSHRFEQGEGHRTLVLEMGDREQPVRVILYYKAYPAEDVIEINSVIENLGDAPLTLREFYSAYLPLKAGEYHLNHFHGAWAREMMLEQTRLTHGIKTIESRKGIRTTHSENPSFLLALDRPLDENYGEVVGGALAWSGNFRISFEVDEFDILNITAGINPYASQYTLGAGDSFTTPPFAFTWTDQGAGGITRNLHDWARNHVIYDPATLRPTLLNSWEGAYFTFDAAVIKRMIDDAADLGLEMFVLDDGWFGNKYPRNAANAALGDWEVNMEKLPDGIDDLARYAHSKGIKFGIWIEPEMVNPKSETAENNPGWIVRDGSGQPTTIRGQWVLDLTNPEVQDFVFGVFDRTMQLSPGIDYIKWDCNRHIENPGSGWLSPDAQSHFWIDYTRGLYSVYERVREKYPTVIIQACASGGGRVDYGALRYHQEVWTSDNTDAITRAKIQYGTNMIYPALVTGSHVSASPNHQTGNLTPLKFRIDMAMSARFGMELQPGDMTNEELEMVRGAIGDYKLIRDIIFYGDLYRIDSPWDGSGYYSLAYVSKDKTRAVLFGYCLEYGGRTITPRFKVRGLAPGTRYKVTELNNSRSSFWGNGTVFTAEYLAGEGVNPRLMKSLDSVVLLLEIVRKRE